MSVVLRAGVLAAAAFCLAGGAWFLAVSGGAPIDYTRFRGPDELSSPAGVLAGALGAGGRGLIQLGILLLLATPVARVALSVVAFAMQRDWFYVGVTLVVLAVLAFSLSGG